MTRGALPLLRSLLLSLALFGGSGCASYAVVRGSPAIAPLGKVVLIAWARVAPAGFQAPLARACMKALARQHLASGELQMPSDEDAESEQRARWFEHYQVSTGADAFLTGDFIWSERRVIDPHRFDQARLAVALHSVALKLISARSGEVMASAYAEDVGDVDVEELVARGCEELILAADPARAATQQKGR